jgi:nicotinamide mononucleotide adenylyltransferase
MTTFVLPGRHQPPHNDHLALIRVALAAVPGPLLVGIVFQRPPHGEPADAFEAEARAQHAPERCPFTVLQRIELLEAAFDEALPGRARDRVRVIPLPRPEAEWPLVQALLPGARTWIVPDVGEAFDDAKASFFRARGDEVLRLALRPTTDGRVVRSLLGDPERLARHVPAAVARRIDLWRRDEEMTP